MNIELNKQSYRKTLATLERQKYFRLVLITIFIDAIFIHKINTAINLPNTRLIMPFLLTFIVSFSAGLLVHKIRQNIVSDERLVERYGEYYNFLAMNDQGKMNKTYVVIRFIPIIVITVVAAITAKFLMTFQVFN